jgi:zinc-ribbon domain
MAELRCPDCNTPNDPDAHFCKSCGHPLPTARTGAGTARTSCPPAPAPPPIPAAPTNSPPEAGPAPPRRRGLIIALAALEAVLVGGGIAAAIVVGSENSSSSSSSDTTAPRDASGVGVDSTPSDTQPVRETPNPDGKVKLKCDYELGDFGDSGDPSQGFRFIAGGTIKNTGNVGIVVKVVAKWQLLRQDPLRFTERVRLRAGKRKRISISIPVTQDQIDAHQSADGDCNTNATIVDSFGRPPYA